jgi:hypothetical protein
MPQITDADVAKVKSLVSVRDIPAARRLLKTFEGERAARILAQLNQKFPAEIKSTPARSPRPFMMGLAVGAIITLVIMGIGAAFTLNRPANEPTTSMLELYRDICVAFAPIKYEVTGVNSQVISDGCMQNALAIYNSAPDVYTKCYETMLNNGTGRMAWATCFDSYNIPTPSSWPIEKMLSTRIPPSDLIYSSPEPFLQPGLFITVTPAQEAPLLIPRITLPVVTIPVMTIPTFSFNSP